MRQIYIGLFVAVLISSAQAEIQHPGIPLFQHDDLRPVLWSTSYKAAASVNIRKDSSTDAPVVGKLNRHEIVQVVHDKGRDGFQRIQYNRQHGEGFVWGDLLAPVTELMGIDDLGVVNESTLNQLSYELESGS